MSDRLPSSFVELPPAGKGGLPESFVEEPAATITAADRRAYTEALPGTPEGATVRGEIEGRYGGRDAFLSAYDPTGETLGKTVVPAVLGAGALAAGPEMAAAAGAPLIARTLLPRALAAGGQPGVVEPALGAGVKAAAKGLASGAKSVTESEMVKRILRLLGHGSVAGAGFEAVRRSMADKK